MKTTTAPSSYEPRKEAIGNLLAITNPSIVVPDWQRNFSWTDDNTETFWNDLIAFKKRRSPTGQSEYFLGSVVIVRTSDGLLKLLDGQQRLATASILLSAIRDSVSEYKPQAANQIQENFLRGFDHVKNAEIHKLRLNTYDQEFFRRLVLSPRTADYVAPTPEIASHKLLNSARTFFETKLAEVGKARSDKATFEERMAISDTLLNGFTVIAVYSSDEDNAADVFETLNDRGIGLSTPDLLRNLVIRRADEGQTQTIVDLWKNIISFETDAQIKAFLRYFWISKHGDVKTQSLYREMKSVILEDDISSLELTTQLSDAADQYRELVNADTAVPDFNSILDHVSGFGASARILYPVLLAIFQELEGADLISAANKLLTVYVRHSVIAGLENSKLENRIFRAARDLRHSKDVSQFCADVSQGTPDDEQVQTAFERLSITHNGTRRYLLSQIEMRERATEELEIAASNKVHVEHIYPQKPLPNEAWPNHDRAINRLGNLTLLSARLNTSIRNGNFEAKKPSYEQSEVLMTSTLAKLDEWNFERVEARQKELASVAPLIWSMD